jgi:hypothetical protein
MSEEKLMYRDMTPYELGETYDGLALPHIVKYLQEGSFTEKRLAASAINKFCQKDINCDEALEILVSNLNVPRPQVRQYTLKAIENWPSIELKPYYEKLRAASEAEDMYYNQLIFERILQDLASGKLAVDGEEKGMKRQDEQKQTSVIPSQAVAPSQPTLPPDVIENILNLCQLRNEDVDAMLILEMIENELESLK